MELNNNSKKKKEKLMDQLRHPEAFNNLVISLSIIVILILSHLSYLFYKEYQLKDLKEKVDVEIVVNGKNYDYSPFVSSYYLDVSVPSHKIRIENLEVNKLVYESYRAESKLTYPIEKYKLSIKDQLRYIETKPRTWLHVSIFLLAIIAVISLYCCDFSDSYTFDLINDKRSLIVDIIKWIYYILPGALLLTYIIYWIN